MCHREFTLHARNGTLLFIRDDSITIQTQNWSIHQWYSPPRVSFWKLRCDVFMDTGCYVQHLEHPKCIQAVKRFCEFHNISQNSSLPQTTESGNYFRIADLHIFLGGTPPSTAKNVTKTLPTFKNYSRKNKVFSVHKKLRKKVPRLRSIKIPTLCLHFVSEKSTVQRES